MHTLFDLPKMATNVLFRISLFILSQVTTLASVAQSSQHILVRTPQNVTPNRKLPKGLLAYGQAIPVRFSFYPTDDQLYIAHVFEEPLVPSRGKSSRLESQSLVNALAAFSQRKSEDDFSAIFKFMKDFPQSRWKGALLANLGIVYRRTGYYSKAMEAWLEAWRLLKDEKEQKIKVLADRVVSELLLLESWVGQQGKLDSLIKEIDKRVVEGPAVDRVVAVKEGMWLMKNNSGISFKCGPIALNKLYSLKDSAHRINQKLLSIQSPAKGFSLTDLLDMARDIGMNYQMAFRQPGAEVIPKSVVHWRLEHYSALITFESGHYRCDDATMGSTYGAEFWLTPTALDSSASGYFLIPARGVLPKGWRRVSESEGSRIFGKGQVPSDGSGKNNGKCDPQAPDCEDCNERNPMAKSSVHTSSISLHIFDRPIYYTPPKGPKMILDVDYHQRDSYQPANFSYSNLGPKWTLEYVSYVQDNPNNPSQSADVYLQGGGVETFTQYNATTKAYAPELRSKDMLFRICPNCFELRRPDGSKAIFERPDGPNIGRKVFLTRIQDPMGNELKILYDTLSRIAAIQDAISQVSTFSYENSTNKFLVTKVTDPFQRVARFDYEQGKLVKITDMYGIVSSFRYAGADFIDTMSTPYGTTTFIKEENTSNNNRALETRFPMGERERVEFRENAPGISSNEAIRPTINTRNEFMQFRNTFYWDKKAMQEGAGNYTKARLYHWLHGSAFTGENGYITPILESMKMPLENRVYFNYQGQDDPAVANALMSSHPSATGQIQDDGTSKISRMTFNSLGKVTSSTDPTGRKQSYLYDSTNINLLEVRQTTGTANELLVQYKYNSQYLPISYRDAAGMITKMNYNQAGQLISIVNAKNDTTKLDYNADGYLIAITGSTGAKTRFEYDGYGRVRKVIDQEGYAIIIDRDALDRPTVITFPDSTYEQIEYNRLDAVGFRDRLGRWSYTKFDSLDRPYQMIDPLNRIIKYVWCSCGSLSQIIDPMNRATTFIRDIQGRIKQKIYADGKVESFEYQKTTSQLQSFTDAKGQRTLYSYFIDGNIKQISYVNALVPTGSVSFIYDQVYNRIASMVDTIGKTSFTYYPVLNAGMLGAGQLASIDGPLANDVINYSYDSLYRKIGRSINGVTSSVIFDAINRIKSETNVLGTFKYEYEGETERVSSIKMPNGLITDFVYSGNREDHRLLQIWNRLPDNSTISRFDYEYNVASEITKWTLKAGSAIPKSYAMTYNLGGELISAQLTSSSTIVKDKPVAIGQSVMPYLYKHDSAGNKVLEHRFDENGYGTSIIASEFNQLNQPIRQYNVDSLQSGTNPKNMPGKPSFNNTLKWDSNGNLISTSSPAVSYIWNAADRLVKIIQGAVITEFLYDGVGRRIAEKRNGVFIKFWLWDGTELAEERDASGAKVVKRFFAQGEQINGIPYFYSRDHLGSVREMTDANMVVRARYEYKPYGQVSKLSGDLDASFTFTGHFYHPSSGLNLTLYRPYDADLEMWISRDPIKEGGGLNLYEYVNGNPVNAIDPFGLQEIFVIGGQEEIIPPEIIEEAFELNQCKNRVELPDGRRVDLKGDPHFGKGTTGKDVPTPHVSDPKAPHPAPWDQLFPRGNNPVPRPATIKDIQDVLDFLRKNGIIPPADDNQCSDKAKPCSK